MGEGMTNEERIELLKEVARVAPKEWDADHCTISGEPCVQFEALNYEVLRFSDNDIENAPAIMVMLDAMEEAGHFPELAPYKSMDADDGMNKIGAGMRRDAGFRYCCCLMDHNVPSPEPWEPLQIFNGNTRAEAVARAFVEVFKSESPNTPTEPKEEKEDDDQ